jgi:uncharacterized protein with HEPN domain
MQDRVLGWLEDIRPAAEDVLRFSSGLDEKAYLADELKRMAIERQLITMGEAMVQLANEFPEVAERVAEFRQVISFRNILVHRYRTLDHAMIYGVSRDKLPGFRDKVASLIDEIESAG